MRAGWWEVRLGADSLEGTATGPNGEATRLLGTQPGAWEQILAARSSRHPRAQELSWEKGVGGGKS